MVPVQGVPQGAGGRRQGRDDRVHAEILELTGGAGVDRIVDVDFGGNLATSLRVIKDNGAIAASARPLAAEVFTAL